MKNYLSLTTSKMLKGFKAIVFDMDGTLCLPQPWMFPAMRQAVGLTDPSRDILEYIGSLSPAQQRKALRAVEQIEHKAMVQMEPQPGLQQVLKWLTHARISKNVCTRNLRAPFDHLIASFVPAQYSQFDHILTREFCPTKPFADPLLHIAKQLNLDPRSIVMVGDSLDDMLSGRSAGCRTVLIVNEHNRSLLQSHRDLVDCTVSDLSELAVLLARCTA